MSTESETSRPTPDAVREILGPVLRTLPERMDRHIMEEVANADSNAEQNRLLGTLSQIQAHRPALTDAVLQAVLRRLGGDNPPVPVDTELEATVGFDEWMERIAAAAEGLLAQLREHSRINGEAPPADGFPLSPDCLARLFLQNYPMLHLDPRWQRELFRCFAEAVLNELPALYRQWLDGMGVAAASVTAEAAGTERGGDDTGVFESLQGLLDEEETGAAEPLSFVELMAALNALQARHAERFDANTMPPALEQQDLGQALEDWLTEQGKAARPGKEDRDTLRLVTLLFDFILKDANLAEPMKQLLGYLQVPLAKVAILDHSFFGKEGHPARRLLNQMATASLGWTDDEAGRGLQVLMRQAVHRILTEYATDAACFGDVLAEFQAELTEQEKQAELAEQRLLSAEDVRARAEGARERVAERLTRLREGKTLPPPVLALLDGPWANALFLVCQQEGEDSDKWREAWRTTEDLVWSVQPVRTPQDRQKLLRLVPTLLRALRNGLAWAGTSQADMDRLFKDLEAVHLEQLRSKPTAPSAVETGPTETEAAASAEVDTEVPSETDAPTADAGTESVEETAPTAAEKADDARAHWARVVDGLSMGVWVDFCEPDGERLRCKLAAVIRHTGRYVFVNRAGVKVAEKQRDELIEDLEAGRIVLMEDTQLFDRALESVIGNLRDMKG